MFPELFVLGDFEQIGGDFSGGAHAAIGQRDSCQHQCAADYLRGGQRFGENESREYRGERSLRQQADGCGGGREMAEGVGEREVSAQLRNQAEAEKSGPRTAGRHLQRNAEREIDDQEKQGAGNHGQAQECQSAGGHAHALGGDHVDSEAGRCGEGHGVAPAQSEVAR